MRDAELRKMGQVDNCLVDTYVANTRKKKVLDESAMAQFVPIDDFVTTKNQTSQSIHASFERWIYDPHKGPIARFIMVSSRAGVLDTYDRAILTGLTGKTLLHS